MNRDLLPTAPEAEKAIVTAVLSSGGQAITKLDFLKPEYFSSRQHRKVYQAALSIWEKGGSPDYVSVTEVLAPKMEGAKVLVETYKDAAQDSLLSAASVTDYGEIVRQKWLARSLVELGEKISLQALRDEPEEVLDAVAKAVVDLRPQHGEGFQKVALLGPATVTQRKSELPTGFTGLDAYIGGLGRGRLITLAARPGVGKTTLALNIAANAARLGFRVGFHSLEMSGEELLERLLLSEARLAGWRIKQPLLEKAHVLALGKAILLMKDWNLSLDETANLSTFEIAARTKRMKAEHGLDLLVVDYLQLVSPPKADSRVQEVSIITRQLKVLARELDVPILMLSQLNREVEHRQGEPRLSDLRDSGSIEQDSDQVLFLYNVDKEEQDAEISQVYLSVSKNRHGPTGRMIVGFRKSESRFVQGYE